MPQVVDDNGNLVDWAFSNYGYGQLAAYTGTAAAVANAIHTAKGTFTSTGVIPTTVTDTVTIGPNTYVFKTALTPTAGEVLIGGSAAAALLNLIRAINHSGSAGTDYANSGITAVAHPTVTADTAVTGGVSFRVYAKAADASIATSVAVTTRMSWGAAALVGGASGPRLVRAMLSSAGYVAIGPTPVATTSGIPMGAGIPQVFQISAGDKLSAVQDSAGGNLNVIEIW